MIGFGIVLIIAGLIGGCTLGFNDALGGGSGLIGWIVAGGGTVAGIVMIVLGNRSRNKAP